MGAVRSHLSYYAADLDTAEAFKSAPPEVYETLLLDVIQDDSTLCRVVQEPKR